MRTIRLLGGVCPGVCLPREVSSQGVSVQWDVCPGGVFPGGCLSRGCTPPLPPVERIRGTRLWKHYLLTTSIAGGKNSKGRFVYRKKANVSATPVWWNSGLIVTKIDVNTEM